ncbi:MAG: FecR domain-containing protein [Candidatus Wallbacteria bacterium]|nr:FecR domain-containing protein [Candidatus Wallbacteria bacterium]
MNCERVKELLEQSEAGPLSAADRSAVSSHVEGCSGCREHREALEQTVRALASVTLEPFPEHRSRKIMALVRELPPPRRSLWARLAQLLTPAPAWGYAAVPAMAVLVLALWPRGERPPGTTPAVPPVVRVAQAPVAAPPAAILGTVETEGTGATVDGKPFDPGRPELRAGSEIVLAQAGATLRFTDGTRVRLEKRARARVQPRALELSAGRALAAVSKTGQGFQVKSCSFAIKVMGTRFSVDQELCRVDLLEGKVQASEASWVFDLAPGQSLVHESGRPERQEMSELQRRELVAAFLRLEGAAPLAAAMGLTEDGVRELARGPKPPPEPASSTKPTPPAGNAGAKPVFNPVQGLGRE